MKILNIALNEAKKTSAKKILNFCENIGLNGLKNN